MKDRFGIELAPGMVITYPGRQSSSLWMTEGIVQEALPDGKDYWGRDKGTIKVLVPSQTYIYDQDTRVSYFQRKLVGKTVSVVSRVTALPHVSAARIKQEIDEFNAAQLAKLPQAQPAAEE